MDERRAIRYHLLGHDEVAFKREDLERMVREGLLDLETKVIRDGEGFAVALSARPEFRHLRLPQA